METGQFDRFTRLAAGGRVSRRGIVASLVFGALSPGLGLAWPVATEAGKKKKKAKKRCLNAFDTCVPGTGKACCSGVANCCRPDPFLGETEYSCAPRPDDRGTYFCCTASGTTGWCRTDIPLCCPATARFPAVCEEEGGDCCTDDPAGGSCPPGFLCCIDGQAVPTATCCAKPAADGAAARTHVSRNYRLSDGQVRRSILG